MPAGAASPHGTLAGASDSRCWSSSDVGNQTDRGLGEKRGSTSLVHGQH